jgi:hypothetical protein
MLLENSKSDKISVGIAAEHMSIRCDYLQGQKCVQNGSGCDAVLGEKPVNLADYILRLAIKSDVLDYRIVGVIRIKSSPVTGLEWPRGFQEVVIRIKLRENSCISV